MKKLIRVLCMIGIMLLLVSCSKADEEAVANDVEEEIQEEAEDVLVEESEEESSEGIDVDLTTLSSTMVYAEVNNMYMYPDNYIGEIVKMEGTFFVYESSVNDMIYFSVIIEDALGCCAQGIEFELEGEYTYPDDYPEIGTTISVVGEFETYLEDGILYCRLKDSVILGE